MGRTAYGEVAQSTKNVIHCGTIPMQMGTTGVDATARYIWTAGKESRKGEQASNTDKGRISGQKSARAIEKATKFLGKTHLK